ncbi:hypothetical protein LINPERPRIM_LOCUS23770 [Linum perenne]
MAMSQRSGIGGRGGFTSYRRPQRQLPHPRPFRPPAAAPPPPPPPTVQTFEPKLEIEQPHHNSSFVLRLHLPGFTKLEQVKITKATDTDSEHIVRVHGEILYPQDNRTLRFDTTISVPPEFDISPPIDAKLDTGVLTLTFPKFSSSSSSYSDSESESSSSSDDDDEDDKSQPESGQINRAHDGEIKPAATVAVTTKENLNRTEEKNKEVEHKKPEVDFGKEGGEIAERKDNSVKKVVEEGRKKEGVQIGGEARAMATAVGKSDLVVNMGAAVAVIAALGTYTYYVMFT